jgi:TP901 family phage tail tape measure protein
MALERIGLGGILTFEERQAVQAMGKARNAYGRFTRSTDQLKSKTGHLGATISTQMKKIGRSVRGLSGSLKNFSASLTGLAVGGTAVGYAMGRGVKTAATFEQSILNLGAVALSGEKDLARMAEKSKELGIKTAFSATQSADAMTVLKMAGATTEETLKGIGGMLDLAAAGSVDTATAVDIATTAIKGLNMKMDDSKHVADVLALSTTKGKVAMLDLGEAMRMSLKTAGPMEMKIEELGAILTKLGDASMRGTLAGTAFNSMMAKLAKPSSVAGKKMEEWRIELEDSSGKLLPVSQIVEQFSKKIGALTSDVEKNRLITEFFGERGKAAYAALARAGRKSIDKLTEALQKASKGIGVATDMANRKLAGLTGQFTMMKATVEGLSISIYGPLKDAMTATVTAATSGLNGVLYALQGLQKAQKEGHDMQLTSMMFTKRHGETAVSIAQGLLDVVNWLRDSWNSLVETVGKFGAWLKSKIGVDGVRALTRLAGKLATIMATMAPLLLAFKAFTFVIGRPMVAAIGVAIKLGKLLITTLGGVTTAANAAAVSTNRSLGLLGKLGKLAGAVGVTVWAASELKNVWDEVIRPLATGTYAATKENIERGVKKARGSILEWSKTLKSETKKQTYAALSESLSDAQSVDLAQWLYGFKDGLKTSTRSAISEALEKIRTENFQKMFKTLEAGLFKANMRGLKPIMEVSPRTALVAMGVKPEKITTEMLMETKKMQERYQGERAAALDLDLEKRHEAGEKSRKAWLRLTPKERERVRRAEAREEEQRRELERKGEYAVYLQNTVNIDGKKVAGSLSKHQQEIQERAGFKATPWQRRMMLEQGAMPATASARSL